MKYYVRSKYKNLKGYQVYSNLTLLEAQNKLDWLRRRGRTGRIFEYK